MNKERRKGTSDRPGRVHAIHGVWFEDHQLKYSISRELINLVEALEEEVKARRMKLLEILFMTDNSVAEAVYYWENSSDKNIFELILQLFYLELRGCFRLHIIWT